MAKHRGEPLEEKGWFDRADHFHFTALSLMAEPAAMHFIYAYPHIVMKAFATEAYLKCLIKVEGNEPEQIHHLLSLFDKLSPESKKRIESQWNKESKPTLLKIRKKKRGPPNVQIPKNLRQALNQSANAFLDWRYHGKDAEMGFTIMAFPLFVRGRILELRPDWAYQPPHPLAALNPKAELIKAEDDSFGTFPPRPAILNPKAPTLPVILRIGRRSNPDDSSSTESF